MREPLDDLRGSIGSQRMHQRKWSIVPAPAASYVPDVPDSIPHLTDPVADIDPSISENEAHLDYVLSSASESGSCSGDEEVLRSFPTSVLAAQGQKRPALPALPSDSAESSVDLRDNELPP